MRPVLLFLLAMAMAVPASGAINCYKPNKTGVETLICSNDRVSAADIERLPITVAGSNRIVPREQIATVTLGKGPSTIQHADGKRMITVSANLDGLDQVVEDLRVERSAEGSHWGVHEQPERVNALIRGFLRE